MFEWFKDFFKAGDSSDIDCIGIYEISAELSYRKLAFQTAINLIANALSKCEFRTFERRKETKGSEYYLWNIEPNQNQNSSEFIHNVVWELFTKNECLIISENNQLYVADSYNVKKYALHGNKFNEVTIGDVTFKRTFEMKDVLFLSLGNENVKKLIDSAYKNYGELIAYAQKNYKKSRGTKGRLRVNMQRMNDETYKARVKKLLEEDFKTYFENDNAILPLYDGFEYDENTTKTYSRETTRDIKAMIDDVYDLTARAICIPPALIRGDMANIENSVDNFLTFCIKPLADKIQEEVIRKRYGYQDFIKGDYLKVDTNGIKNIDVLDSAVNIDKLISSGVYSVNGILKLIGEEEINEEWAKKHYITKNYTEIDGIYADG